MSECAGFNVPLNTLETSLSRQIDCTGTNNKKQGNKTLHTPENN